MRTFYQDEQVHVTSSAFHVDGRRYPLVELDQVWRSARRVAGRRLLIGVGVLAAAVGFTALVRYTWWFGGLRAEFERWLRAGPVMLAVVGLVALVLAVLGVVAAEVALRAIEDIRGHARQLQLWATIRGRPVLLLQTNDRDRFGRVCRALIRARAGGGGPTGGAPRAGNVQRVPGNGGTMRDRGTRPPGRGQPAGSGR